ncbi:MAG: flagellar basal-body MS-ring/collar protein FliF [Pseudomonadota bacterium]
MSGLADTWKSLTLTRKLVLAGAVAGTIGTILALAQVATKPSMALLYGGLEEQSAGEVVGALEQMNVPFDIRGGSIYVDGDQRDFVRMSLAREGLPQQGQKGYELLDNMSGFGTTSEMFEAAYWRAKEGELARTIMAVPGVSSVRVHIGNASRRPFQSTDVQPTAAVTVRMTGGALSEQSALSIRYLVSLSVAGIDPKQVAVIDAKHGVILRPGQDRAFSADGTIAEERAKRMEKEIEKLLSVRVGDGNVRVSVTVETTTEQETISERIVDPDSRVTLTADNITLSEISEKGAANVTVASNLPDGDAAGGGGPKSEREETRENVAYSYSETRRDQVRQAGAVKRIGVAVLIDDIETVAEDGTVSFQPRSPEELAAIQQLVRSAVAFDEQRGDVVTVESMRFAPIPNTGEIVEQAFAERFLEAHAMTLVQLGILSLVALLLGLLVVRPILKSTAAPALADDPLADVPGVTALPNQPQTLSENDVPSIQELAGTPEEMAEQLIQDESNTIVIDDGTDTMETLRDLVADKTEESAALLRSWLAEPNRVEAPA